MDIMVRTGGENQAGRAANTRRAAATPAVGTVRQTQPFGHGQPQFLTDGRADDGGGGWGPGRGTARSGDRLHYGWSRPNPLYGGWLQCLPIPLMK